ncbi:acyltransferase [Coniophora puteana RWD-64-598 SS2]|uniref:Acyltransferase n=1 Tax=Coniophora puteana (strain RWD-64-598) TaxID=741705 RepID=A0A5M3M8G4_CONPW|nr:acyltransferase [Coniophora puteana RWD-64-598 SS2]EIW75552.1 acyltransferase [Coniophora puteana RWD-64-598 SS2]
MPPMLAYRFLRKISDWTLEGFYSDVHVSGREHVPEEGPLIIAATHHNEIIDIAALSATIPHRRQVRFWAKSTMFKNIFARELLTSAGSIPVQRNPDSASTGPGSNGHGPGGGGKAGMSQAALFRDTSAALAAGSVVGVFPEGTSYSEPRIVQVKDGAAWAAVEYAKAVRRGEVREGRELVVVPAAVVYTDKSQYQSRVCVRYGEPIPISRYVEGLKEEDEEATRAVVKGVSAEIERRLRALTINAEDWDTLSAAAAARELFFPKPLSLGLDNYVDVSQSLVDTLTDSTATSEAGQTAKGSLVRYLALQRYTGISSTTLESLFPSPLSVAMGSSSSSKPPGVTEALRTFFYQLVATLLHPRALLFFPMFAVHAPGYLTGWIASYFLSPRTEEESKTQFKAIFGGLGLAASYSAVTRLAWKFVNQPFAYLDRLVRRDALPNSLIEFLQHLAAYLHSSDDWIIKLLKRSVAFVLLGCGTTRLLWSWHNLFVMLGVTSPTRTDATQEELKRYSRPKPPLANPFIKSHSPVSRRLAAGGAEIDAKSIPTSIPSTSKFIRPLFAAREEAQTSLRRYITELSASEAGHEVIAKLRSGGGNL